MINQINQAEERSQNPVNRTCFAIVKDARIQDRSSHGDPNLDVSTYLQRSKVRPSGLN